MKKLLILFLVVFSCSCFAQNKWALNSLITSSQTLTNGWVNLGSEINTRKNSYIVALVNLDINDSKNFRIRRVCRYESGGDNYDILIQSPDNGVVNIETEYFELNVDADTKFVEIFATKGCPYIIFQVEAGTVGASAGKILTAKYTNTF